MLRYKLSLFFFVFLIVQTSAQLREQFPLSGKWLFFKGDANFTASNFPKGEHVSIPHTWNASDGTSEDYYRGKGTYRCTFDLTKNIKKKRIFIRFEAVSLEAEIFLNGQYLGNHKGAFNAFCFEITPYVKKQNNELIVKVSNALNPDVAPLSGDFTVFGGIYRPVSLLILPQTCITPLDYASSGIYIKQTDIQDHKATLDITAKIDGNISGNKKLRLRTSIFDPEGKLVSSSESENIRKAANNNAIEQQIYIENPVLWNGKVSPNQYRFFCEVLQGKKVIDTLSVHTGLRYFNVDPEKGFFLNGKSYQIRGVNRHQDRKGKGWAISETDHQEDMRLIKEIGANGIRLAHYPHSNYFYSLCDREGLLVWAEIPFIGNGTESTAFEENLKQQLIELIRQNFNHPSIFCWSLFNELVKGNPEKLVAELNDLAHKEDPTRLTVAAANIEGRPENTITDIMAFNTYPGWYWADPGTMGPSIDWKKDKKRGVCISEYGAGASIKHHQQNMTKAPKCDGELHPEEWQAIVHEGNYKEIAKRDFVWGSFVWNMFDFASAGRKEGDTHGMNDKGLVTYDRKVKKDAFYFYKANWSDKPVLHIASKRHIKRSEQETDIKVYSNCSDLLLYVNGIKYQYVPGDQNIFVWKNIRLQPGKNEIKVSGKFEGKIISDQCEWIFEK
ncbi:glycoside hydrolase family 2 protein [Coprobacter sp.]